jgi:hypothetical protein
LAADKIMAAQVADFAADTVTDFVADPFGV